MSSDGPWLRNVGTSQQCPPEKLCLRHGYMWPECGCPQDCRAYPEPPGLGVYSNAPMPFAGLARAILFNEPPPKPRVRVKAGREVIA